MKCRSCNSENIKDVMSLGEQYLSDFTSKGDPKPPKYPLNLVMCKDCTLVQLRETTPATELYTPRYGYKSGISETIKADLRDVVRQVFKRIDVKDGEVVVDIGANDGTLLANYEGAYRVGFEPVKKFADEIIEKGRAEAVFNDFFKADSYNQTFNKKAKVITAISMFYDLDDPNTFVHDLADVLDPQGLLVIQQNYLVSMMKNKAYDNICHEHVEYYSLTSLEKLLNRHGLEVVDVEENSINGGSFRTYVKHMDNVKRMRYKERQLKLDNEWTYYLFALQVKHVRHELKTFIEKVVGEGKKVYLLGASTRGNTLLQYCGLDNKLIGKCIERNTEKFGKVIASTGIPIVSEEEGRKDKPEYMLVLPYFFRDQIAQREAEYVKQGGKLIFPLPKLEIYG